jgi:hypothetical protein
MGNSIRITNRYVYNQTAEALRCYKEGPDLGNVVTTVGKMPLPDKSGGIKNDI